MGAATHFSAKLQLPSLRKHDDSTSRVSSALSKSYDLGAEGRRPLNADNDLINEETIRYFIEQNFLMGKRAHELPKYNPYAKKSG